MIWYIKRKLTSISFRRESSLDIEIAASGYTKEMQEDDELLFPECSDEDDHTTEEREFVEDAESNANFLSQDKENNADFIYEVVSESRTSEDLLSQWRCWSHRK